MAKRNVKTLQQESEWLNMRTYNHLYSYLKELALNVFKWENLPDSVDERFLELILCEYGYLVYFQDEILGDLALTSTMGGELNVYRIPKWRRAYANNGYQKELNINNSVLIFNNYLHTPTEWVIEMYARRLMEVRRTIDVNINSQKTPLIILASEQQRLTMQQFYMKYSGNEPFIFGDKNMGLEDIKVLQTPSPFVADKLFQYGRNLFDEFLTFIGVENSNANKKERLVSAEVGSNYGNIEASRNVYLNARNQGADMVNKMFGRNIKAVYNTQLKTMVNPDNFLSGDDVNSLGGVPK